jgi:hypothetical protein
LFLCGFILKKKTNSLKQKGIYLDNETIVMDSEIELMGYIVQSLKKKRLIYRPYVSVSPFDIPGGLVYRSTGDMSDPSGDSIGTIRIEIYVPYDSELPVRIRIEWTKDVFGFWYREDVFIPNDNNWEEDIRSIMIIPFRMIEATARGSIKISSMNLGIKKIKKNNTKDSIFGNSMRLW